jgi:GT2 family glycosyltransferase
MTLVSIILVNYNGATIIKDCLYSLQQFNQTIPSEIIVVDNASGDGSPELIRKHFPEVKLICQTHNHGFGKGNNIGAKVARGDFLLFLNPDTILTEDFLPSLLMVMMQNPEVGIVAPKLVNRDGSLQISTSPAIGILGEYIAQRRSHQYHRGQNLEKISREFSRQQEVAIVVGAALLIRTKLFTQLRGFDENFFMYFEESDLCQRARYLGWKVVYNPEVSLIHLLGESTKKAPTQMALEYRRSQIYYYQKHRPGWEQKILQLYLALKFALLWLLAFRFSDIDEKSVKTTAYQVMTMALRGSPRS